MKKKKPTITIFASHPRGVENYTRALKPIVQELSKTLHVIMTLKDFDDPTSIIRSVGRNRQTVINEQIECDILIVIFGKYLGSPTGNYSPITGDAYQSGSIEELDKVMIKQNTGSKIEAAVFFIGSVEIENRDEYKEYGRVIDYRATLKDKILIYEPKTIRQFKEHVKAFLEATAVKFSNRTTNKKLISYGKSVSNIIPRLSFSKVEDYIYRSVVSHKDYTSSVYRYLISDASKDLIEVIKKEKNIVLLADAGMGKTTELNRIAYVFSQKENNFHVFFKKLNLYTGEIIEDFISTELNSIPDHELLILLDGFDEIQGQYINTAAIELEKFVEKHNESRVVISCRSNFYNVETDNFSGSIKSFSTFVLTKLTGDDVSIIIPKTLRDKSDDFWNAIQINNLTLDLLYIPFYLKYLLLEYQEHNKLPKTREELFNKLIESRIILDEEHFRTSSSIDLLESRTKVLKNLSRLAISMEMLGRNYISFEEYCQIIPDEESRKLLKQKTLWHQDGDKWQFEHNSFQEFLAAKALVEQNLDIIKKTISFGPKHKVIIPSWVNTLSFLLNIYPNDKLKNWVLRIQPELMVKFEPDRIDPDSRTKIFKNIFHNYKEKKIWINREKFDLQELANFGQSDSTIRYLMKCISPSEHPTTVGNAINLLSLTKIHPKFEKKLRTILIDISVNYRLDYIQNEALCAISSLKYDDNETISSLFDNLGKSDNDWIRYGLYFIIENSNFIDRYIDYFLEGIQYVNDRFPADTKRVRIGNEFWHMENGLKKAKSPEAIVKILDHFLKNPENTLLIGFDRLIPVIMENSATTYIDSHKDEIFIKVYNLFIVLHEKYFVAESKLCLTFFDKSNSRFKACQNFYMDRGKHQSLEFFSVLAELSNLEWIEKMVKEYTDHNIVAEDFIYYQNCLRGINSALFEKLNKRIIDLTNDDRFKISPPIDYESQRKQSYERDFSLLFDKQALISEINLLYRNQGRQSLSKVEVDDIRHKQWMDRVYSQLVLKVLSEIISQTGDGKLENVITELEIMDWDYLSVRKIYEYQTNKHEVTLTSFQLGKLESWCLSNVKITDYSKALTIKGHTFATNFDALLLWHFYRVYKFNYPKEILLEMLGYDWWGIGIDYLEGPLSIYEITQKILNNLRKENLNEFEIRNYFNFCKKHKISEAIKYGEKEVLNVSRDKEIRKLALDLLIELDCKQQRLFALVKKLKDDFKWEIVEFLHKRKFSELENYLLTELRSSVEANKIIASRYLIKDQNFEGLQYYTQRIITSKKFKYDHFGQEPLLELKTGKAVPYLMKLLRVSYESDLIQDKFHSLQLVVQSVLTNIALLSERNFITVSKSIENFIKRYKNEIDEINFLYSFLERLERQYYVAKSKNIRLDDVISRLKDINLQISQ